MLCVHKLLRVFSWSQGVVKTCVEHIDAVQGTSSVCLRWNVGVLVHESVVVCGAKNWNFAKECYA